MRQVLASIVVSALALLSACGGDGGSDETLTAEEAQRAVERAMLTPEDLGEGWQETGTSPPSEDGTGVNECLSDEVAAESTDPVAESDTQEFTRGDSPTQQQQVQLSTAVMEDDLAARLVEELASADVRDCLGGKFREQVADGSAVPGLTVELGDFEADEDFAGAGDGATRLRAPMEVSAEGLTLPATVDMVVVHTDQIVSALVGFALGEPLAEDDLEAWTQQLAELQAG